MARGWDVEWGDAPILRYSRWLSLAVGGYA